MNPTSADARSLHEHTPISKLLAWAAVVTLVAVGINSGNSVISYGYRSADRVWRIVLGSALYWFLWWPCVPLIAVVVRRRRILTGAAVLATLMIAHASGLLLLQRAFHLTDWYTGSIFPEAFAIVYWRFFEDIPALIMFAVLVYLSDQAVRRQRVNEQLVEARLETLRTQLNPHFLLNALNGVMMLIRAGENPTAVRMLAGVSSILQRLLSDRRSGLIPLEEELAFLNQYLEVEKLRFGDRLTIGMDVDTHARGELIPAVMLQPLVENAVRHGVEQSGAGNVGVRIRRDSEMLRIEISDDGAAPLSPTRPGVGLGNVQERLRTLYGGRATLSLRREAALTITELNIPCAS
jgi:hypothetical protein